MPPIPRKVVVQPYYPNLGNVAGNAARLEKKVRALVEPRVPDGFDQAQKRIDHARAVLKAVDPGPFGGRRSTC